MTTWRQFLAKQAAAAQRTAAPTAQPAEEPQPSYWDRIVANAQRSATQTPRSGNTVAWGIPSAAQNYEANQRENFPRVPEPGEATPADLDRWNLVPEEQTRSEQAELETRGWYTQEEAAAAAAEKWGTYTRALSQDEWAKLSDAQQRAVVVDTALQRAGRVDAEAGNRDATTAVLEDFAVDRDARLYDDLVSGDAVLTSDKLEDKQYLDVLGGAGLFDYPKLQTALEGGRNLLEALQGEQVLSDTTKGYLPSVTQPVDQFQAWLPAENVEPMQQLLMTMSERGTMEAITNNAEARTAFDELRSQALNGVDEATAAGYLDLLYQGEQGNSDILSYDEFVQTWFGG